MRRAGRRRPLTAAAVALTSGALLLGPATAASADPDDASFSPVASDLARKPWVELSTTSGAASAALAVDGDPATAWQAARKPGQALTLDLGGAYDNVRKVELVFPDPDGVYRYVVEASSDGTTWETVVDRSRADVAGRGEEHLLTRPGTAFLRVRLLDATRGATPGISELRVWNYLRDDLVLGADLSYADQDARDGLRYWTDDPARAGDLLGTVAGAGMEYVRLRVFNDPRDERTGEYLEPAFQGPERTLDVAERVVATGMDLGIDLHYSDSWADPSKQAKPTAWRELPFDELTDAVHDYTYGTVDALLAQGTVPAKVAVGNELINGFMWGSEKAQPWFEESAWCGACYFNDDPSFVSQPGGAILWDLWGSQDPAEKAAYDASWDRFVTLQSAGIRAVREAAAAHGVEIPLETHVIIDQGRVDKTLEFWDQFLTRLNAQGEDIDVLAHSYYPDWHGSPEHYEANLHAIAAAHPGYAMEIAETSHQSNDYDGLPVPNSPYPKTAQGAGDFLQRVFQIANDLPDNRGVGVLVWEPANWQEMVDWDSSAWPTIKFHETVEVFADSDAEHVLEDTVHVSVRAKDALALPATVDVLSTADGTVTAVPVTWDAAAGTGTSVPGSSTVTGSTAYGPVTAVVDVVRRHL
ncbi:glycosyl hydrolase 53 family protein [Cellulomonas endophytica]|uniref:glycosyl hydrolase 53 family protein n=1 Tax=Cellulomonas endophytica TaxID=2494735 RepID=UPI0010105E06|nr:glycosyl hydrolase 53 family protein [Cellulomonas endophytica]